MAEDFEGDNWQAGYDEGYDVGYDEGEASARRDADVAYEEGHQAGYEEGQQEAESAGLEALKAINKWLEERGVLDWSLHPDGLSTSEMMDLIYEHEDNIALAAKIEITSAVN